MSQRGIEAEQSNLPQLKALLESIARPPRHSSTKAGCYLFSSEVVQQMLNYDQVIVKNAFHLMISRKGNSKVYMSQRRPDTPNQSMLTLEICSTMLLARLASEIVSVPQT
jgi:hypothetical protein